MSYLCDVCGGGVRELSGLHLMSEEEAGQPDKLVAIASWLSWPTSHFADECNGIIAQTCYNTDTSLRIQATCSCRLSPRLLRPHYLLLTTTFPLYSIS